MSQLEKQAQIMQSQFSVWAQNAAGLGTNGLNPMNFGGAGGVSNFIMQGLSAWAAQGTKDKDGKYAEYDRAPLYTKVVAGISPLDNLDVSLAFILADKGTGAVGYSFYPYIDYDTGLGTIRTGARFNFKDSDFSGIDIPLSWTYKFKIK